MKYIIQTPDDSSPEDLRRFRNMLKIDDWIGVVQELDNELRRLIKYDDKPPEVQQELTALRQWLYEAVNERQLDLDS